MTNDYLAFGQKAMEMEADALKRAAKRLGSSFEKLCEMTLGNTGKVVVTGLGKSGHVGRKIAATLASTGSPSLFLHPTEALHGDLGVIQKNDLLLAIAFGGETEEVLTVVRYAKRLGVCVASITGKLESTLAKLSDLVIDGSVDREVCPHNLAPTSSSTVALAIGDAYAVSVMEARQFKEQDFAKLHPSGALGRRLLTVQDLMKPIGDQLPVVTLSQNFHDVLNAVTAKNYGIVPVVSSDLKIVGAVSDGDIRRALLRLGPAALQGKVADIMNHAPKMITEDKFALEAFKRMEDQQITSLFVETSKDPGKLVGIIRMHDLLAAKIV